jgi:hypothetical protein
LASVETVQSTVPVPPTPGVVQASGTPAVWVSD